MGIQNRDYYRDEAPPGYRDDGFTGGSSDRTIRGLIIACAVVFFAQNITAYRPGDIASAVGDLLTLTASDLRHWQLWRIFTYGFCHGGFMHIFFNMFSLWVLGRMVEGVRGSRETFSFFLAAVAVSGLAQIAWDWNRPINLMGASGGVFGLIVLAAMHFPRAPMQLMFLPVVIELRYMAIIFLVLGFLFAGDNVAHVAHFGGAAFGAVYYLSGYRLFAGEGSSRRAGSGLGAWFFGFKQKLKKNPTGVQLYEPPAENLDAEVDRILAKINEQGKGSLTPEEQATLDRASQEYRKRV
ncbi:MAG: rhomboid family intramembrane serine protease [Planctomycetes bacterium]|nr:rhomboid family intramembrane serine protease [Planctomycetota bacterium]